MPNALADRKLRALCVVSFGLGMVACTRRSRRLCLVLLIAAVISCRSRRSGAAHIMISKKANGIFYEGRHQINGARFMRLHAAVAWQPGIRKSCRKET